eukprot:gene23572-biopygen7308
MKARGALGHGALLVLPPPHKRNLLERTCQHNRRNFCSNRLSIMCAAGATKATPEENARRWDEDLTPVHPRRMRPRMAFTLATDRAPSTGTLLRSTRDWETTGKGSTGPEGDRWMNKIRFLWRSKSAANTLEQKVTVAVSEPYRSFPLHHRKAALSAGPR